MCSFFPTCTHRFMSGLLLVLVGHGHYFGGSDLDEIDGAVWIFIVVLPGSLYQEASGLNEIHGAVWIFIVVLPGSLYQEASGLDGAG
jgi:hypothetical protein